MITGRLSISIRENLNLLFEKKTKYIIIIFVINRILSYIVVYDINKIEIPIKEFYFFK